MIIKQLLEEGVIYRSHLTPSSISVILFFRSYSTSSKNNIVIYTKHIHCTYESKGLLAHFRADRMCNKVCVTSDKCRHTDACIHNYFQTSIMHIFCFTQLWPPYTRTCIPQGIQPKWLCATEQGVFLNQKRFKDCDGW